jgi:hypothetical protein
VSLSPHPHPHPHPHPRPRPRPHPHPHPHPRPRPLASLLRAWPNGWVKWGLGLACWLWLLGCAGEGPGTVMVSRPDAGRTGADAGHSEDAGQREDAGVSEVREVDAELGATLSIGSGFATLQIPADALTASQPITLRRLVPNEFQFPEGMVFEVLPHDVTFDPPATLRIDTSENPSPLPWLVPRIRGGDDSSLERHTLQDGDVAFVDIAEGGVFEIGWLARGLPEACAVRPMNFSACGGALEGDWQFEGLCYPDPAPIIIYETPHYEELTACSHASPVPSDSPWPLAVTVDPNYQWPMEGTLQIADGQFKESAASALIPLVSEIDRSCFSSTDTCTQIAEGFLARWLTCEGDSRCTCQAFPPTDLPAVDAAFTVDTNALSVDGQPSREFCVDGEYLRIMERGNVDRVRVYRRP